MAATNIDVQVSPTGNWTQLTTADVTAARVVNKSAVPIHLQATVGATPPTTTVGSIPLQPGLIIAADLTLAQLWPGVTGATRIYAFADVPSVASISHA